MNKDAKTESLPCETLGLPRYEGASIADWLSEIEQATEAADDDMRRKYTNIGGHNGLELFV